MNILVTGKNGFIVENIENDSKSFMSLIHLIIMECQKI